MDLGNIDAAKVKLPLPELLRALGFAPPASGEGNMPSPLVKGRRQRTPSFSIFRRGDVWGWCDRTGGSDDKGDEITLLERLEGLTRPEAVRRFLTLAGVEMVRSGPAQRSGAGGDHEKAAALDWPAAVAKFTPEHAAGLARWRGLSPEFVDWLREQALVGVCKESIAFPVHDAAGRVTAAHVRPKSGRWFYTPRGGGCHPLIIGDTSAARTMVFESQWDAFAIMDAAGWHRAAPEGWAVLITRGASNGRFAKRAAGTVYAWPQNDADKDGKRAGEIWLLDVVTAAPADVRRVATPERFKDANDWTRAEAVDVWAAIAAAVPVEKAAASPASAINDHRADHAGNNGSTPASPFDPAAALDDLGLLWLVGSSSYFLRREETGRVRFLEMGQAEIRRKLRVRGYRAKPDPERGESVSPIDRVMDAATEARPVDFAISIGGMSAGVYDLPGGRVIVRDSPRLIEPRPGDFQHHRSLPRCPAGW